MSKAHQKAGASARAAKTALFDEFARVGQALSSGRRMEILDVLANGERSVDGLAQELGLSLANASQHLQVLRQAGLVSSRREGTFIYYELSDGDVFELWRSLRNVAALRRAEVGRLAEAYVGARDTLEAVTRQELRRRLRSREGLVVLDVRPHEEFAAGHVPEAISIPITELRRRLQELPQTRRWWHTAAVLTVPSPTMPSGSCGSTASALVALKTGCPNGELMACRWPPARYE